MPDFDPVRGIGNFFSAVGSAVSYPFNSHDDQMYAPGQPYLNPNNSKVYYPGNPGYPGVGSSFGTYANPGGPGEHEGHGSPENFAPGAAPGPYPYEWD